MKLPTSKRYLAGLNNYDLRCYNRRIALKLLYQHKGLSKSQLSETMGLSIPAVSKIVQDLIDENRVEVEEISHSGRGNHRGIYKVTSQRPCTICISIIPGQLMAIVVDNEIKPLTPLAKREVTLETPEQLIDDLVQLIVMVKNEANVTDYRLAVAVHGQVDVKSGASLKMPHAQWQGRIELKYLLQSRLNVDVLLDNDCVMMALAEKWKMYEEQRDFCVLNISNGIGSSFLISNDVYRGPHFGSGQIGHTFVEMNGHICGCGREGCLETVASLASMKREYCHIKQVDNVSTSDLIKAFHSQDVDAVNVVNKAAKVIGRALYNFLVTLDINQIILYGETCQFGSLWLSTILNETLGNPFESGDSLKEEQTAITFGKLTEEEKLIGISYLWVEKELDLMG
ncbi:hypothetical protein RJ45_21365 [Photobacterium gaetbulicola]|uniref:ROK family transcriptional regulator n=1 Tax=Photobacterium gaetbulicola TaxID=1295392 RepID=A0A0B9GYK0_9GAMM|nr:hypothetical protein RJ45_21365 [Photobacterium gaetbulicola]